MDGDSRSEQVEETIETEDVYENEGEQSTLLVSREEEYQEETNPELEENPLEDKDKIVEPDPNEYEKNQEPLYDPSEAEFIKDMEDLGRILREAEENKGVSEEELKMYDDIGFNAEQYYKKLKEQDQESKNEEEIQEITESSEELLHDPIQEQTRAISSDNEPEEEPEDYPKEAETVHEVEYFINAEEKLYSEGKSSYEIAEEMQQIEDIYDFTEEVERMHKDQENEELRSIDHAEEEEEDEIEEIDRIDIVEHAIEKEEELQQQGLPREEIDEKVEDTIDYFYQEEKEQSRLIEQENVEAEELISESTRVKDYSIDLQETEEIVSTKENVIESLKKEQEAENEEYDIEELKHSYTQETGKQPIYAGKNTKGFNEWLGQQKEEELTEKQEKEYIKEEWKKRFKELMDQSEKNLLGPELELILTELLQKEENLEELFRNCESKEISKREQNYWRSILMNIQMKFPIHFELYRNVRAFKAYVREAHPWDIVNIKPKFLNHLIEKHQRLKQILKGLNTSAESIKDTADTIKEVFTEEEVQFLKDQGLDPRMFKLGNKWTWLTDKLAHKYFRALILPHYRNNPELTQNEVGKLGYQSFISALRYLPNVKYGDFILKMRYDKEKELPLIIEYLKDRFLGNEEKGLTAKSWNINDYSNISLKEHKVINDILNEIFNLLKAINPKYKDYVTFNKNSASLIRNFIKATPLILSKNLKNENLIHIRQIYQIVYNTNNENVSDTFSIPIKRYFFEENSKRIPFQQRWEKFYKKNPPKFSRFKTQIFDELFNLIQYKKEIEINRIIEKFNLNDKTGYKYRRIKVWSRIIEFILYTSLNKTQIELEIRKEFEAGKGSVSNIIEYLHYSGKINGFKRFPKVSLLYPSRIARSILKKGYRYIEKARGSFNIRLGEDVSVVIEFLKNKYKEDKWDIKDKDKIKELINCSFSYLKSTKLKKLENQGDYQFQDKRYLEKIIKLIPILNEKKYEYLKRKVDIGLELGWKTNGGGKISILIRNFFRDEWKKRHKIVTSQNFSLLKQKRLEFSWNKLNLDQTNNVDIKEILTNLIENSLRRNYPKFHNYFGCSNFCFRGSIESNVSSSYLLRKRNDLSKFNIISKNGALGKKLIEELKKSKEYYHNLLKYKPGQYSDFFSASGSLNHEPLLTYLLFRSKLNNVIAKETFIWAKVDRKILEVDYLTGHIDLIAVKENLIYIIDYKPNCKNFLKYMPQVGMYGLLLKKRINNPNIKVKCLMFNEKNSCLFDPTILFSELHYLSRELDEKYNSFSPIWEPFIESIFKMGFKKNE
ncbi:MAG: hypothetical protein ACFFCI_03380 [Promethearchaeota archaeon]